MGKRDVDGTDAVTRDTIELEIWKTTGVRHVEAVDRLLGMIDTYVVGIMTDGRTAGKVRRKGKTVTDGDHPSAGDGPPMRGVVTGHPPFSVNERANAAGKKWLDAERRRADEAQAEVNRLITELQEETPESNGDGESDDPGTGQIVIQRCGRCQEVKSATDFAKDVTRGNGLRRRCRMCEKVVRKELADRKANRP